MRIQRASMLAASLLLAMTSIGCESTMNSMEPVPAEAHGVSAVQFADIPVPHGMTMREHEHRSFSVQAGSQYRFAEFVYEGDLSVAEIGAYMTERMPQHAWQQVDRSMPVPDVQVLRFRRGREIAECSIQRDESTTRLHVTVKSSIESK